MNELRTYLNGLPPAKQVEFAKKCKTSLGYLRKALSTKQKLGAELCINIERESKRAIVCESLRPDIDWASVRKYCCKNTKEQ